MFNTILSVLALLISLEISQGRVFWETRERILNRLQHVPPAKETAEKMEAYLLHRQISRLVKREVRYPEDVLIIIDSSKSVPEANFTQGLKALQELVMRFRPDTNFAAILFSTGATVSFPFIPSRKAMEKLIQIKYNGGYTNTQAALRMAIKLFLTKKSGIRLDAYKSVFILTDGQSNVKKRQTLYQSFILKEMGIEIYVMAVGEHIDGISELAMLATSTDKHMYRVGEMNGFMEVVQRISRNPSYADAPKITRRQH